MIEIEYKIKAFLKDVILNIFIVDIMTLKEIILLTIQFLSVKIHVSSKDKDMTNDIRSITLI